MLDQRELDRWAEIRDRPSIPIAASSSGGSRILLGQPCLLAGYAIRESAAAGASITYLTTSSTGAAAVLTEVLAAGAAGVTTWCTGFEVTGGGATAASVIVVTLAGLIGGTRSYVIAVPAGVALGIVPLVVEFAAPGIPAATAAAAITLTVPSLGAGNTNAAATIAGYQQTPGAVAGVVTPAPAASFNFRNGPDAAAEIIASQDLTAGGVVTNQSGRDGPICRSGIFLEVLSGTFQGAIWVKT